MPENSTPVSLSTKELPLSRGLVAVVDAEDYLRLSQYKWHATTNNYAAAWIVVDGVRQKVLLHRFILSAGKGLWVDHINHDTLNCTKSNLRLARPQENSRNKLKQGRTSRFKGVCWHKRAGKWQAGYVVDARRIYLGLFVNEVDAAKAYDSAVRAAFGEFAFTNFKEAA
jgi:hypothetical protein